MAAYAGWEAPAAAEAAEFSILDSVDKFFSRYVVCSDAVRWAAVLYCAATSIIRECATFPRFLITAENPGAGKTILMELMAAYCINPLDGSGTGYDLVSALMEAHMQRNEVPTPAIYIDEISNLFGKNGLGGPKNSPVREVCQKGYKCRATRGASRQGEPVRYSIFVPVIMAGLRTAVPPDIRTRCIVAPMKTGKPKMYYDVRDAESKAIRNARSLYKCAREVAPEVAKFRIARLGIPELDGRKGEVWEPLFAIALALGGMRWVNNCLRAFRELAMADFVTPELSDEQQLLSDAAEIGPRIVTEGIVPGRELAAELMKLESYQEQYDPDDPRDRGTLLKYISDAMPCYTHQKRLENGDRVRGYWLADILKAWEQMKPPPEEEWEMPELEDDPFAVSDDEEWDEDLADMATARVARVARVPQPHARARAQPRAGQPQRVAVGPAYRAARSAARDARRVQRTARGVVKFSRFL